MKRRYVPYLIGLSHAQSLSYPVLDVRSTVFWEGVLDMVIVFFFPNAVT